MESPAVAPQPSSGEQGWAQAPTGQSCSHPAGRNLGAGTGAGTVGISSNPAPSGNASGGGGGVGQDWIRAARWSSAGGPQSGPAALPGHGATLPPAATAWPPAHPTFAPAPTFAGPVLVLPCLPSWVSAPL